MNANELADELEDCEPYNIMDTYLFKATATMLRQQQAEIEGLEKENTYLRYLIATMLREQQDEIKALKILVDELAGYKASYENCHRMCNGYGMN